MQFDPDLLSFLAGFIVGILFVWLVSRVRPLLKQMNESRKEQLEAVRARRSSGLENNYRRVTLRRAQGMHLASALFSLGEILQEPRLIAPPTRVEPGVISIQEDIISQTLPYMPAWPELAAIYRAPTLSLAAAGTGKTVAMAHLASLAANLQVRLEANVEAVPDLYHVADLGLPHEPSKDAINIITNAASE